MDLERLTLQIARNDNFSTLPQVMSSVIQTLNQDNVSGMVLEKLIERDAAIAAKILRAANSSYYGCQNVPTLGRAISVLGLNTVKSLVVGIAFQQMIAEKGRSTLFDRKACWRHCLAVATGSRLIAKLKMPLKAEELYSAGILHDVGILALDRFCSHELDACIRLAFQQRITLAEAEREVLRCDHCQIGAKVAERWGLSAKITAAITHHLEPFEDKDCFETTCVVSIAEGLANQFGFPNNSPDGIYDSDKEAELALGLTHEEMVLVGKTMHEEVNRAEDAFQLAA